MWVYLLNLNATLNEISKLSQKLPKVTESYQKLPKVTKSYRKLHISICVFVRLEFECHFEWNFEAVSKVGQKSNAGFFQPGIPGIFIVFFSLSMGK
jgi:hypothetical protein